MTYLKKSEGEMVKDQKEVICPFKGDYPQVLQTLIVRQHRRAAFFAYRLFAGDQLPIEGRLKHEPQSAEKAIKSKPGTETFSAPKGSLVCKRKK